MRTTRTTTTTRTTRTATTALALSAGLLLVPAAAAAEAAPAAAEAAPSSAALLQVGDRGAQVREWQALLNRLVRVGAVDGPTLVEDGVFGPATRQATRAAQERAGVARDGVVGPRTRSAVSGVGFASGVGGTSPSSPATPAERRLRTGMSGADVREWQRVLGVAVDLGRLDHPRIATDGVFGPRTRSATVALQRTVQVTADGVVGPVTREATGWLLEG